MVALFRVGVPTIASFRASALLLHQSTNKPPTIVTTKGVRLNSPLPFLRSPLYQDSGLVGLDVDIARQNVSQTIPIILHKRRGERGEEGMQSAAAFIIKASSQLCLHVQATPSSRAYMVNQLLKRGDLITECQYYYEEVVWLQVSASV